MLLTTQMAAEALRNWVNNIPDIRARDPRALVRQILDRLDEQLTVLVDVRAQRDEAQGALERLRATAQRTAAQVVAGAHEVDAHMKQQEATIGALREDIAHYKAALQKYGAHSITCDRWARYEACTCGYAEAVRGKEVP